MSQTKENSNALNTLFTLWLKKLLKVVI